jgi:MoaA/NifB/PqqE/SkfB family radical SAM enzyme
LINRIGAQTIISSGIDDITISIGGFDHETYARVFRVDHWDSVYAGMLNLLKENQARADKVNICIALRSDIPIWESLRKPAYRELKRYPFELEFNLLHFDNWSGRVKQEHLTGTMQLKNPPEKSEPCSILYRVPKILSNGDMTLCGCRDLDGDSELVFGNIRDKSILEMWRDPRVENIRSGFYSSRYPEICQDCSMYSDLSFFREKKLRALLRGERLVRT